MSQSKLFTLALAVVLGAAIVHTQDTAAADNQKPASALVANRIILRVTDLTKSIAFYRDLVGLPLQSTFEEFAVFDAGGGLTLMLQRVASTPAAQPNTGLSAMTEVVLESADVLASYQAMQRRGVAFRIEPRVVTVDGAGRDLYAVDFRDPDGHVLSIAGWRRTKAGAEK